MRVGLVSRWHVHANEYASAIKNNPNTEVAAVWDDDRERGKRWAEELGCEYYSDYSAMLNSANIDAVVIASPTSQHPQLLVKAAKAGKHIFTEKALTIRLSDAKRVEKAVLESGVKFVISFPHKTFPQLLYIKSLIDTDELGKITYARVRNVHNGSSAGWLPNYFYDEALCGGGAMIDLGAHPMYLLEWLLGKPLFVQSQFSDVTSRGVEDNAVSLIEFENGAIGVSETGFVSEGNPYTVEVSGTKGYASVRGGTVEISSPKTNGRLTAVTELPEGKRSPIDMWIDWCCEQGAAPEGMLIDDAVALTALTEASYDAAKNGEKTYVAF